MASTRSGLTYYSTQAPNHRQNYGVSFGEMEKIRVREADPINAQINLQLQAIRAHRQHPISSQVFPPPRLNGLFCDEEEEGESP